MDGLNQSPENGRIGPEVLPDSGPATLNIKVAHGLNLHEVAVPSNSTFGNLKSIIVQKTGLKPETCKLLFRGKEKDDDEFLQTAGLKDNCKVLLMEEDTTWRENVPEEVKETNVTEEVKETNVTEEVKETIVISQGEAEVAEVRREVDNLADQVAALKAVVDSETKVDNKDIIYLTEMLMRALLRLDGIVAEGEGRLQRKMEVRRVQSLVETMDILKTKNSSSLSNGNGNNNVPVTTQWETSETASGSLSTISTVPASAPTLNPTTTVTPPSAPSPAYSPSPVPNHIPVPSSNHTPVPFTISDSSHVPSSASSLLPSSAKVTQEWENFD